MFFGNKFLVNLFDPFQRLIGRYTHKRMDTGEIFVIYREGDEERSSEAAMCGGSAQRPILCAQNDGCAQRTGTGGKNPLEDFYFLKSESLLRYL